MAKKDTEIKERERESTTETDRQVLKMERKSQRD